MKIPRTELFLMENDDERINGKRIISDEHSTDIEETSLSLSVELREGKIFQRGKMLVGEENTDNISFYSGETSREVRRTTRKFYHVGNNP